MSDTEKITCAKAAISHALNAICDDPRKYYLLGPLTGTYEKLTAAHAALHDLPVDQVRKNFVAYREPYDRYCELLKEEERLIEIGRAHQAESGGES